MSEVAEPDVKRVKLAGDEEGQGTAKTNKEAEKVGSDLQFSYLSLSCKTKSKVKTCVPRSLPRAHSHLIITAP